MTTWNVWMEGYRASGNSSAASLCGTYHAETFADACAQWAASLATPDRQHFDPAGPSYWGCRLFDSEAAARLAYG